MSLVKCGKKTDLYTLMLSTGRPQWKYTSECIEMSYWLVFPFFSVSKQVTLAGSSFLWSIVLSGLVTFSPAGKDGCHNFKIKNWTSIIVNQFGINWLIDFPRHPFIDYLELEGIPKIIESSSWPRTCHIWIIISKIVTVTWNKKWFLLYLSILELWASQTYEFWVIRLLRFNKLYKLLGFSYYLS